jgi:universal stress protein A
MELALRTVVVPTDLSEVGDAAIPWAFRLAADHGARVVLLHVIERLHAPSPLYAHYYPTPSPEQQEEAAASAVEALRSRVPGAYRERVAWDAIVVDGNPAEEIVRVARDEKASLVALSSHARRGLAHLVLGSVADRVAARAPCPVLIVR